jgi:hypothetical protein
VVLTLGPGGFGVPVGPTAWVTLDHAHNDGQRFWDSIAVALRRSGVLRRPDRAGAPVAGNTISAVRQCVSRHSTPVRLILDEGQHLDHADGFAALTEIARQSRCASSCVPVSRPRSGSAGCDLTAS